MHITKLSFLQAFFLSRLWARARSDYPVIFLLLPFILGQVLFFILGPHAALFGLLKPIYRLFRRQDFFAELPRALPFFLGIFSAFIIVPHNLAELPNDAPIYIKVVSYPKYPKPGLVVFKARVLKERNKYIFVKSKDLPWRNASKVERNDTAYIRGKCDAVDASINPFSYNSNLYRQGISEICNAKYMSEPVSKSRSIVQSVRDRIVNLVNSKVPRSEDATLFLAMLIGASQGLSERTESAFKKTGLAHLLVVSGYQVTLFYYIIHALIRYLLTLNLRIASRLPVFWISEIASLAFSLFYTLITGADSAVVRAAIAISLIVLGKLLERGKGFLNVILSSLLIISVLWPGAYLEPGTQLSFAALFGIWLGTEAHSSFLSECIWVSFYACIFSSIIVLCWFGTFSLWTFILNPICAELVSVLSCKGALLGLVLSGSGLDAGGYTVQLVAFCLREFKECIMYLAGFDYMSFECDTWAKAMVLCILLGIALRRAASKFKGYLVMNGLILQPIAFRSLSK